MTDVGRVNWIKENVIFVSWHKRWKGVYIHFLPRHCYRIYWRHGLHWDKHRKTERLDRFCDSPYCDKKFSTRDPTQMYCYDGCKPPGPPDPPPGGHMRRWGETGSEQ